jgi:hypothetical protein
MRRCPDGFLMAVAWPAKKPESGNKIMSGHDVWTALISL